MRAIVLIKQVPDLRAAPVGIGPDGTIARESAPGITNPTDLHALEAALRVAEEVVVLTMGPPAAEEVLRDAIARGATSAYLLCDHALAGSDTWATSNALAAGVSHLGGADLVVCGLSALDGETGQVGPELAERLGLPQATGCEDLERVDDRLRARRIVEGGYERLSLPIPALVTVAETGFTPRYPTLPGRRRAARAEIGRLDVATIGLERDRVGLHASPTKVARMAPAPVGGRDCRMIDDDSYDELAAALRAVSGRSGPPVVAPSTTEPQHETVPGVTDAAVWVVCEINDGALATVSTELLSKAAELAPALGGGVAAVCVGADPGSASDEAASYGADVVYTATHSELTPYRTLPHARVLHDLLRGARPAAVLFGATTTGRDLAPRVAAMLDTGLAADCTDLEVAPWERLGVHYDALLHQIRPAMAGGVLATCVTPEARPQMATVRPGVFAPTLRPRQARRVDVAVTLTPRDLEVVVLDREVRTADLGLAEADVIVAGGAGCDATTWHLIEELADAIGGRVAASRGAVEAGLAPRGLQVGQTGATVRPHVYIACGVSGALQHVVGMRAAGTVVAINRDPDAFIFAIADYGIVADVVQALPRLTAALRRAASGPDTHLAP